MADNLNLNTGTGPTKSRAIDRGSDVFTQVAQIDYTQVIKNVELQRFIAQQILITLELRRIAEDEDDIEMLLLL